MMKLTLKSSQSLYNIMKMIPYFYSKKVVHDLLNFTSQGRIAHDWRQPIIYTLGLDSISEHLKYSEINSKELISM